MYGRREMLQYMYCLLYNKPFSEIYKCFHPSSGARYRHLLEVCPYLKLFLGITRSLIVLFVRSTKILISPGIFPMYFVNIVSTMHVHATTIAISLSCHNAFSSVARIWYFLAFSIHVS